MNLRCLQIGIWLERRSSGLRSGQGLQLEEHLAQCPDCRAQADRLDALRGVIESAPSQLSSQVRKRVIQNALASAARAAQAPAQRRWATRGVVVGIGALAFAGAAAAAVTVLPRLHAPEREAAPGRRPAVTRPLAEPAPQRVPSAGTSLPVAAKPAPEEPSPQRGDTLSPTPGAVVQPDAPAQPGRAKRNSDDDAAGLLRRARAELARGAVSEAQVSIARAQRSRLPRTLRAEADSLLAECELVAGRPARAEARYLEVAARYARSEAGENALFAAARLAQQRGDVARSRTLLQRYLGRYPNGRFGVEVRRKLERMAQP